jgi:hypothetical protein
MKMQKFTKAQSDYILNTRRNFNKNERSFGSVDELMGCATPITKDAWGDWDKNGIGVARDVLAVFSSIASSNSRSIPLSVLVAHFQQISDSGEVNTSIDGRSKAKEDQAVVTYVGTPIPIYDSVASWGWRQMLMMKAEGGNLESTTVANKQRKIAEKLEDMTINGVSGVIVGGANLYGLTNHPQRNTRSTGVTLNGATGAQWVAEFKATLQLNHADNHRAPQTIYLNWDDWFYAQTTDYSTAKGNNTIAERVQQIPGIKEIVPASNIVADTIIALDKQRDTVEMLNGMPMTQRPINRLNTEDDFKIKVMAAQAIQLKYDSTNQMGLAHSS